MNKKLLFAALSLVAFTACTDNEIESQKVAEEVGPVQFELLNNNDAFTRATLNENGGVDFSATTGDLFTLYHGATTAPYTSGYGNATYKASEGEGKAVLTTPTMINAGEAIMVWPVDSEFNITPADPLALSIPLVQGDTKNGKGIQYEIPYVSDRFTIDPYAAYSTTGTGIPTAYRTAGYNRTYTVYMRPMASQLNLIADYAGTDDILATLEGGDDGIDPIKVTSVDLLTKTGGTTLFTQEIPLKFSTLASLSIPTTQWSQTAAPNNKWSEVTDFDITGIAATGQTDKLTTKCLTGNESSKFLLLPQATMATAGQGVSDAGIVVNTIYGKVVVADGGLYGSKYTTGATGEIADAWYRYLSAKPATDEDGEKTAATAGANGKFKCTSKPEFGLKQTINGFSAYKAKNGVIKGEPVGAAATRYVKVLLSHLDMSELHVTTDKQLRDAARVWQKMGLDAVTVYLDGNTAKSFEISQKTIETINKINAAAPAGKHFYATPCATHACNEIVITGGGKIQDLAFITDEDNTADVVLKSDFTWKWDGSIKVHPTGTVSTGINTIINRGTLENSETKTLNIVQNNTTATPINIKVKNDETGKWNITAGTIRVQNEVENFGTVTISKGAQYRQDGANFGAAAKFTNNALTLEKRFNASKTERIGTVVNYGVFAAVGSGEIDNYSLIKHEDNDAKTYITHNQKGGVFANVFGANTNMMGRINLPFSNKDEDNISISAVTNPALMEGFVSVTIDAGNAPSTSLSVSAVGEFVNYLIVNGGINEIANLPTQIKYVEVDTDKELAWNLNPAISTIANYDGLIILSDVNIKLGTTVNATVTYLGAEMYVGGTFNKAATDWDGYYGVTSTRVAEHYITFK